MSEEITLQTIYIHLVRLEAKMDEIGRSLDKQQVEIDRHWKKLSEHDKAIALLEQRQSPRVHPTVWVLAVIAILGFVASFATWVTN
jgi:hypothetical protein